MYRAIVADTQPIYLAGTARVIASESDIRVCGIYHSLDRLTEAIARDRGAVVIIAAALKPNWGELLEQIRDHGSRAMVIVENGEPCHQYTASGVRGILYRNSTSAALLKCMRRVIDGAAATAPKAYLAPQEDAVGANVLNRLTMKEIKIVGCITRGMRNRVIAEELGTTEQVIKNYLRSIFDKSGVSDRLELALFTIHHPALASAVSIATSHLVPIILRGVPPVLPWGATAGAAAVSA